jgi:hypothetical protein
MLYSKYNSLNYTKYLNNCDLNYKYFLKSITETPSVDKIIVELPTNMLPNIENTEDDYQNRLLLKCFLAFYFMNFKMPYINCNSFQDSKIVAGTRNSFHYAYLSTYSNSNETYQILSELFNENDRYNNGIKTLTKLNKNLTNSKHKEDILNFRLDIQATRISNYKEILNVLFTRIELQKLKLKLNIVFKKFNNKMSSFDEFKNFFYMWNI